MGATRWLYLDMNAFFASAEQQLQPELRGKPVAVVPVLTDRTCCIAASYEARPFGVRTGTNVGLARQRCPHLHLVLGRHERYIELHHQIAAAIETVLPIEKTWSVDEFACRLSSHHQDHIAAMEIAREAKQAVATQVGPYLRCSVGLGPNRFLAKVAAGMQKPDGLTLIAREDLPDKLHALRLEDLPGIGRNMVLRLEQFGVRTVRQLCATPPDTLRSIWRGSVGVQWWRWLQGEDVAEKDTRRGSVGHSHVLPPEWRTAEGARAVLVRLLHKAAARMRRLGYCARRMDIGVGYRRDDPPWSVCVKLADVQDTPALLKSLDEAWRTRPAGFEPRRVWVTLHHLTPQQSLSLPLFPEQQQALRASRVMDLVNAELGPTAMYFSSMHESRDAAPLRIAFANIPDVELEGSRDLGHADT